MGISLRQAAIITALAYLLNPVTYAEFALYPKLVVAGNVARTVANIDAHAGTFGLAIVCYFICFVEDIVIAWALYVLLAPVNRALSLLSAWLRLAYAVLALAAVLQAAAAYRLVVLAHGTAAIGSVQLQTQVQLLLVSFRSGWGFSLVIFGLHLVLLGYLIYRSQYIPKVIGALISLMGVGWMVFELRPYLYPGANLGWIPLAGFVEILLPLWLLFMGWRIKEPAAQESLGVLSPVDVG